MSAPTAHPLEALLAEALHARADLVDAHDLAPSAPPAVVVPLRKRRRAVGAATLAAGLAAAAAVVAVTVGADGPVRRADTGIATGPTVPTSPGIEDLLPDDEPTSVEPGAAVTYDDGSVGDLVPTGGGFELRIVRDGVPLRVPLPGLRTPRLQTQDLDLGDAHGWVVEEESGDSTQYRVVLLQGDALATADVAGEVPLVTGFLADFSSVRTTVAGEGTAIYTRVFENAMDNDPDVDPHLTYAWTVAGTTLTPVLVD